MKHFLLSIGLLLLGAWGPQRARAQAPAWQSARAVAVSVQATTLDNSEVTATAVDAAGNVYLAGNFTNVVLLGSTTLISRGGNDVFVAKLSPATNQIVWARQIGDGGNDVATALTVSGTSVYVAGSFASQSIDIGATTLFKVGYTSAFVAKLTDAGSTSSFAWALRAGGTETDYATALAVSGTSVYMAGYFTSPTAGFGAITLTKAGTGTSTADVFVAKLTDAGNTGSFVWAQRAGGTGDDKATALAMSGTSVYAAGSFASASATFGAATLATAGTTDVFVTKMVDAGATGSFAWAQRAGGVNEDQATAVAVSGTSVFVAGSFRSATAGFGTNVLTNANPSTFTTDIFLAKLTDAGNTSSFVWAQRAGGADQDYATVLAVSGTSVYMAGGFESNTVGFGATTLTNAGPSTRTTDVFVAKLTDAGSTGAFAWAQRAGGVSRELPNTLTLSGTSLHVAGSFSSATASFGSTNLTNPRPDFSSVGFLASLTDPTLTATAAGRALAPAQLFPNPARRTVALRLPTGTAPAPLVLTDAQGRAVRRYPAPAAGTLETALDLRGLPAGLYGLRGAGFSLRLQVE